MNLSADDLRALHEELSPPAPPDGAFGAGEYGKANNIHATTALHILRKAIGTKFGKGKLQGGQFRLDGHEGRWRFWVE